VAGGPATYAGAGVTPAVDAVIFDHDGTLVDSVSPDYLACATLCEEHGAPLPAAMWARDVCGQPAGYERLFDHLRRERGVAQSSAELWARLRELWAVFLTPDRIRVRTGVAGFLSELKAIGMPLAVASASNREWVSRWVTYFELGPFFDAVVSCEDVENGKPDPAIYVEAAARLGVSPARCAAFEDSVCGVLAARRAGMFVVAVPTRVTVHVGYPHADVVLRDGYHPAATARLLTVLQSGSRAGDGMP
jgi:beta-phosphoglucomutase